MHLKELNLATCVFPFKSHKYCLWILIKKQNKTTLTYCKSKWRVYLHAHVTHSLLWKAVWLTGFYIRETSCQCSAEAKLSPCCHHIVWLWLSEVFTVNHSVFLCCDERCSVAGLSESVPNIVRCIQNGPAFPRAIMKWGCSDKHVFSFKNWYVQVLKWLLLYLEEEQQHQKKRKKKSDQF